MKCDTQCRIARPPDNVKENINPSAGCNHVNSGALENPKKIDCDSRISHHLGDRVSGPTRESKEVQENQVATGLAANYKNGHCASISASQVSCTSLESKFVWARKANSPYGTSWYFLPVSRYPFLAISLLLGTPWGEDVMRMANRESRQVYIMVNVCQRSATARCWFISLLIIADGKGQNMRYHYSMPVPLREFKTSIYVLFNDLIDSNPGISLCISPRSASDPRIVEFLSLITGHGNRISDRLLPFEAQRSC